MGIGELGLRIAARLRPPHVEGDAIRVHSKGGLGNQLFILLAGLALADRSGARLQVDPFLHRYTAHLPFLLERFLASAPPNLRRDVEIMSTPDGPLMSLLLKSSIPASCSFAEDGFPYDARVWSVNPPACLTGYFQSWRYLEALSPDRKDQIRQTLARLKKASVVQPGDDVVLHIRRGDYVKPEVRAVHGLLPLSYYAEAVQKLRRTGAQGRVTMISESPISEITELEELIREPITQAGSGDLWTDMYFMSRAKNLIIANSTFSWMAAWLSGGSASVVAPAPWFAEGSLDTRDLLPPTWAQLRHHFS